MVMVKGIKGVIVLSDNDTYLIPALAKNEVHRTEIIVKKSRFITSIGHTKGVDEAKAFIEKISLEFADARHNCFAYNADKPGSTGYAGCSDDGEPHGTAGKPMLNVVIHSDIGEITAVVTRYFGGILLGTGGLVKAYQDSVKNALDTLKITPMVLTYELEVQIGPRFISQFLRLCQSSQAQILNCDFGVEAIYKISLPQSEYEIFKAKVIEMTSGQAKIIKKEQ